MFVVSKASYLHASLAGKRSSCSPLQDWVTAKTRKDCQSISYFFTVRFPGIFVFVCVLIWLFACLSTLNVIKMRSN